MVRAYYRPVFDFTNSLEVAKQFYAFRGSLRGAERAINATQTAALAEDAFSGAWGDEFRIRASEQTTNIDNTATKLARDADDWGACWQEAAAQMNRVLWAEAYVRQIALVKERNKDGGFFGTGVGPSVGSIVDSIAGSSDEGDASKEMPDLINPGRPKFDNDFTRFAHFASFRNGEPCTVGYSGDAPGPGPAAERDAWIESEKQEGTVEPAPPEPGTPEPVPAAIINDRSSLGTKEGTCSINLPKVDAYLEALGAEIEALLAEWDGVADFAEGVREACLDAHSRNQCIPSANAMLVFMQQHHLAISAVRALAGEDGTGTVELQNKDIDELLTELELDEPPGLIQISTEERLGLPGNSGVADDPINAATGNFYHHEIDLDLPGFADAIAVERVYNAGVLQPGAFGLGWSSVLEMVLFEPRDGGPVSVRLADGALVPFAPRADGTFAPDGVRLLRLERLEHGFTLTKGYDETWTFDAAGELTGGTRDQAAWTLSADRSLDEANYTVVVTEQRSGRSVTYLIRGGLVAETATSDGRVARYHYEDGYLTNVERPTGDMTYEIGDNGRISRMVDADGVLLAENTYDRWARTIAQLSPFGRQSRYEYGDNGTFTATDDADGPSNVMVHDKFGNMTSMVGGDGKAMRMKWDDRNRLIELRDRGGNVTTYEYLDDLDRDLLIRTVHPDGTAEVRIWDDLDRLETVIRPNGGAYQLTYLGESRLPHTVTDPQGAVTTFVRDERGLPTRVIDGDGIALDYTWNTDGQMATITDARGRVNSFTYAADGCIASITSRNGQTCEFETNTAGRVVATTTPDGNRQTFGWTAGGRPAWCRTASNDVAWALEYADHGEPSMLIDSAGSSVEFEFDQMGNRTKMVAADGTEFAMAYDNVSRLTSVACDGVEMLRQESDANGYLVDVANADGHAVHRDLDAFGRITRFVDAAGSETLFTYDACGNTTSLTLADGSVFGFEVDLVGRVTAAIGPDGAATRYEYSTAGRLLARVSAMGRRTTVEYDAAGCPIKIIEPSGREVAIEEDGDLAIISNDDTLVSFEFDDSGRVSGWNNSFSGPASELGWDTGRVEIATADTLPAVVDIDHRGVITSITDPAGIVSEYEYDVRGRVSAVTTGDHLTQLDYNALGLPIAVNDTGTDAVSMQYSPAGLIAAMQAGPEGVINFERDLAGRVVAITEAGEAPTVRYHYDALGRIIETATDAGTSHVELDSYGSLSSLVDTNGVVTRYRRDADGLVEAIESSASAPIEIVRDIGGTVTGYRSGDIATDAPTPITALSGDRDLAGRLLSDHRGWLHRYDEAGRLAETIDASGGRHGFSYGAHGLIESEVTPHLGERSFVYNPSGQLVGLTDADGTTLFGYDHRGRRRTETRPDGSSVEYEWNLLDQLVAVHTTDARRAVSTRRIFWSGWNRVERIDDVGIGWDDGLSAKPNRIGDQSYFRSGMQTMRIDTGESWSDGLTADVFGWNDDAGIHLGFRGELTVDGLVLMGERVYDARTRVFLSRDADPLVATAPGGSNSYQFAYCDPINNVDPSGRSVMSEKEFEDYRHRQESSRAGLLWEAVTEDALSIVATVFVVVVVIAAVVLLPGAGVVLAGALIGALVSGGVTLGTQLANRDVNMKQVGLQTLIGGVAGAAGGGAGQFVAGSAKFAHLSARSLNVLSGAANGTVSSGVTTLSNQAAAGDFDARALFTDMGVGTLTGVLGGAAARVPGPGATGPINMTKPMIAQSAAVNGGIEAGGSIIGDIANGRPVDLGAAALSGVLGAGGDVVGNTYVGKDVPGPAGSGSGTAPPPDAGPPAGGATAPDAGGSSMAPDAGGSAPDAEAGGSAPDAEAGGSAPDADAAAATDGGRAKPEPAGTKPDGENSAPDSQSPENGSDRPSTMDKANDLKDPANVGEDGKGVVGVGDTQVNAETGIEITKVTVGDVDAPLVDGDGVPQGESGVIVEIDGEPTLITAEDGKVELGDGKTIQIAADGDVMIHEDGTQVGHGDKVRDPDAPQTSNEKGEIAHGDAKAKIEASGGEIAGEGVWVEVQIDGEAVQIRPDFLVLNPDGETYTYVESKYSNDSPFTDNQMAVKPILQAEGGSLEATVVGNTGDSDFRLDGTITITNMDVLVMNPG